LCLTQTTVSQKSNEITALPYVIETLALFDLTGCIITVDAMEAQREVARLLTEKHALYILASKDNQAKLAGGPAREQPC
jgi:predicted transposase YbfD/YdcC